MMKAIGCTVLLLILLLPGSVPAQSVRDAVYDELARERYGDWGLAPNIDPAPNVERNYIFTVAENGLSVLAFVCDPMTDGVGASIMFGDTKPEFPYNIANVAFGSAKEQLSDPRPWVVSEQADNMLLATSKVSAKLFAAARRSEYDTMHVRFWKMLEQNEFLTHAYSLVGLDDASVELMCIPY